MSRGSTDVANTERKSEGKGRKEEGGRRRRKEDAKAGNTSDDGIMSP